MDQEFSALQLMKAFHSKTQSPIFLLFAFSQKKTGEMIDAYDPLQDLLGVPCTFCQGGGLIFGLLLTSW